MKNKDRQRKRKLTFELELKYGVPKHKQLKTIIENEKQRFTKIT